MTGQQSPLVSVCIPTYNYAGFLADAVDSVLAQTFRDVEIIVVDNCSTDNTYDVLRPYIDKGLIRYVCNETNLGMVGNWNRCIELARGRYIKILCADDLLTPRSIEKSVSLMESNPNAVLVTGVRQLVDNDLKPLFTLSYPTTSKSIAGVEAIRNCFYKGNLIGEPSAVLFRKKHAGRGFNPAYKQIVDLEMWFNLLEQGDFEASPEVLCLIRQHQEQATKSSIVNLTVIDDLMLMFREYISKEYIGHTFLNKQRWRYCFAYTIYCHKFHGVDACFCSYKVMCKTSTNCNVL